MTLPYRYGWLFGAQTAITAHGTIPGMGHGCRSPDKVVRYCQRGHPRKQQLIALFSGEISCILYLISISSIQGVLL